MEKEMNKKKILKDTPVRPWDDSSREYDRIWLIPAGTKHDSGYMHIAIVGVWEENKEEKREICGYPDDISTYFYPMKLGSSNLDFSIVRMDCYYPSGILQYHGRGKFIVSEALSSMDIRFLQSRPQDTL